MYFIIYFIYCVLVVATFNAVLIDRKHAKNSFLVNISDISETYVYGYIILNRISIKSSKIKIMLLASY